MSQFITVQVGQCGNQIGSTFWPSALHEYGIQTTGIGTALLKTQRNRMKSINDLTDTFDSFFFVPDNSHGFSFKNVADLKKAKVKARAVLIDMEDSVIGGVKRCPIGHLFEGSCIVTNYPGSANNWAMGYHSHGTKYRESVEEAVRHVAEKCSKLHGFLIMHSMGGGTGSGLGTAVLKLLADKYPSVDRLVCCIYPTAMQDVVTAPYNALLATRELIEHATCAFPVENEALLDICDAQFKQKENRNQTKFCNVSCKPFQDMNSIVANMLLHLTSGSRFPGNLNMDMNEIATNLVAYPKLHYVFSSVSPLTLTAPARCNARATRLLDETFANAWSRNNQLIKVDPLLLDSVVVSAAHIVRGNCSIEDLKRNVERFRKKVTIAKWAGEAMKVGLCSVPPIGHSTSLLCLLNSSSISLTFKNIVRQFDRLYKRKAHVYHYTQVRGFEETDFTACKETISDLIAQYAELQSRKQANVPRLQIL